MDKLQGKVAVITGATQGIGLATAKLFVSEGAYVFITGRRHKELEEAVASIGNNVTGVQGDASDWADFSHWEVSPRSITTRSSIRMSGGCSSPSRRRSRF